MPWLSESGSLDNIITNSWLFMDSLPSKAGSCIHYYIPGGPPPPLFLLHKMSTSHPSVSEAAAKPTFPHLGHYLCARLNNDPQFTPTWNLKM